MLESGDVLATPPAGFTSQILPERLGYPGSSVPDLLWMTFIPALEELREEAQPLAGGVIFAHLHPQAEQSIVQVVVAFPFIGSPRRSHEALGDQLRDICRDMVERHPASLGDLGWRERLPRDRHLREDALHLGGDV